MRVATIATLVTVVGLTASTLAGGASAAPSSHTSLPATTSSSTTRAACERAGVVVLTKGHAVACPSGWAPRKVVTTTYKFNATYSGTISIIWSSTGKSTATITGKGSKVDFGLTKCVGAGSAVATAQSDPINGNGTLSGTGEYLKVKFATGSTATAASSSPPTVVTISGSATVTSGAGKFLKATGSLKVSGEFAIQNTTGSEKDSFSATLKGTVKTTKTVK